MVDVAGRTFARDEHEDSFDDFALIVRRIQSVPDLDAGGTDEASTDLIDIDIYLGIGLALLGQVGVRVLDAVADMAIERSAQAVCHAAAKLFRRKDDSLVPESASEPTPDGQAVIARVRELVVTQLPLTAEQATMIVTVELAVLAEQDGANRST